MKRVLVYGMTDNLGGMETFMLSYIRGMQDNDIVFDFIAPYEKIAIEQEVIALGGKVYHLPSRKKSFFEYHRRFKEYMQEHANEYDAVWLNDCMFCNLDLLKFAKKFGIKTRIIHAHNSEAMGSKSQLIRHTINKNFVVKYATDFWACSDLAAEWSYPNSVKENKNYKVIPNAINTINYRFREEVRCKMRKDLGFQVAGIISACPKVEKNNLFTLDIVCRGIPSPGVCTAWLNKKMESIDEELVQFDFRNKSKFGWAAAKETIYTNSKQYDSDEYAKLFYGHNMIRPSCYKCLYRGLNRVSDITLGDAWGVGEADFFDEKGISLVLVNSNRGEKMMEDVDLYVRKVDIQNYMQPALTESFKEPADRNAFWRKYHSSDILDVMLFENGTGLFKVKRYVRKAAYQLFRRLGKNDENLSK